jgi:carboxyl-terminal processing protease
VVRCVALSVALGAAFTSGVVTGVAYGNDPGQPDLRSGVIDEAADRIETHAARTVEREQLERAAVEGMLQSLGDRWSSFYQPSEFGSFTAALDGRYSGVGLWLRRTADGRIEVSSVQPGSPAVRAGMRTGDEVLAIDGRSLVGLAVSDTVRMLRGSAGSRVWVRFARSGAVSTVMLTRTSLSTADVTVEHLRGNVLRIRVAAFTRGVGRQVRDALAHSGLQRSGGVILDLRDNPGGLLDEAVEVASAFLRGGPVVSYERRGQGRRALDAYGRGDVTTPLVVLVDGGTASAAEVVAAAMQDRNRAVLIGSRTYGKGSVQEPTRLSDGSAIELTVGRFYTPAGQAIDGVGVEPDVLVDSDGVAAPAERRALEVLSGLVAALGTNGRG